MKLTERIAEKIVTLGVLFSVAALPTKSHAQSQPGRAEVRAVRGSAVFSTPSTPAMPLKVGTVLPPGATISTALDSSVDLFLGNSAGVVRLTETTTLGLDKLTITDTGADTVVEVQLNLPEGTIFGNVNRLSAASKYEIKLPNGVAGIRGTRYRCSSTGFIVLPNGSMIFVHVPPGGQPTPYTLTAPPAVFFSPIEGVKAATPDMVEQFNQQFSDTPDGPGGGPQAPTAPPQTDPFVAPTLGDDTIIKG